MNLLILFIFERQVGISFVKTFIPAIPVHWIPQEITPRLCAPQHFQCSIVKECLKVIQEFYLFIFCMLWEEVCLKGVLVLFYQMRFNEVYMTWYIHDIVHQVWKQQALLCAVIVLIETLVTHKTVLEHTYIGITWIWINHLTTIS